MPTSDLQSLSYLGANLMLGRNPRMEQAFDPKVFPIQNGGDVDVSTATLAYVNVACREHFAWRTCYFRITTVDLTCTYTITIDGEAVAYVANDASLAIVLQGIVDAINADADVNTVVVAGVYDYDGDGVDDSVRITGLTEDDYSFDGTENGTAAIELIADAVSCTARLLGRPDYSPASSVAVGAALLAALGWRAVAMGGEMQRSIDAYGWSTDTQPVNGLSALRVLATSSFGHPDDGGDVEQRVTAIVAPCRQESSE